MTSWTNWGWSTISNLTTTTVSTVQSTLEVASNYVKPTIDSVSETTSQILNNVADAINVIDEPTDSPPSAGSSAEDANQSIPVAESSQEKGVVAQAEDAGLPQIPPEAVIIEKDQNEPAGLNGEDKIFAYIDSTIDNSVSFITSSAGYSYLSDIVKKGVVAGTDVVGQSFEALENLSSVITNLSFENSVPSTSPNDTESNNNNTQFDQMNKPVKSFSLVFEEVGGTKHLQALEHLSVKCMMKTQQIYLKLSFQQREIVDDSTTKIHDFFKNEHQTNIQPPLALKLSEQNIYQLTDIIATYNSTKEKLVSPKLIQEYAGGEFLFQSEEEISKTIEEVLTIFSKIEDDCTQTLANLSTMSVELLLRVSESSIAIAEGKVPKPSVEDFAEFCNQVCILCSFFDQELTAVSTLYIDELQKLLQIVKSGLQGKEQSLLYNKWINSIPNNCRNIYIHVSNAISFVEEAKKLVLNVSKYVVISYQVEEKNEPKT